MNGGRLPLLTVLLQTDHFAISRVKFAKRRYREQGLTLWLTILANHSVSN